MAALEEELGIPLLYKNGRDTLLTPYGQEFLAYAERAIQEIEEGKRVAQSRCSPTRGQVRLGFISAVSATLIPWCVSHFYQNPDNQGITFPFDEKPTRRIAADFTHHALDIGPELLGRVRDAFRGLKEQGKLRHGGGTFDYGDWAVRL